ncbi:MAG TPA: MFS transporter [Acidimicrobiales bacterium]|nr:MFS transporter [Acidimicrobiales bacterium]
MSDAPQATTDGIADDPARTGPEPEESAEMAAGLGMIAVAPADAAPRGRRARLLRVFTEPMWVLGLVVFIDEADKSIVRGMITPIKETFGVGDLGISVMLSLALLFNGIVTVPAGYLADRWNRSRAVGRTVVGWSAISALGATALNFPMLVALRSALGFGQAVTEPSAASLLGDYYPPESRGKAFSIQQVMLLAGTGAGVALGGGLAALFDWRVGLMVAALPGLAVAWLVLRLREPKRGSADLMAAIGGTIEHEDADDHPRLFEHGLGRFTRDMMAGLREDMRTIMDIRTMRYALVGVAALLFTITAIAAWLPQYYERQLHFEAGVGEAAFGLLALLGGVPGVLVGGRVADRWAPRLTGGRLALPALFLFAGTACFTGSYLFRAPAGESDVDWAVAGPAFGLQLLGLFIVTMSIPGLRAGLTDAIPAHLRGAGFGAFNLVAVVAGQAAAPFIVGALSSVFDENLRTAFLIVTPFSFLGAAILFRARRFLDEDMQKIMMAVLTALQDERDRQAADAAEAAGSG